MPVHEKTVRLGDDWVKPGKMVSNGAYMLEDWKPSSHIRLVKNPNYWNAGKVAIDAVVFDPTENLATVLKRYRAGEFDIVGISIAEGSADAGMPTNALNRSILDREITPGRTGARAVALSLYSRRLAVLVDRRLEVMPLLYDSAEPTKGRRSDLREEEALA